ncbi:MAG: hypothetical protein EXS35_05375 [Pedosphaera sp.]|nr:hypothetical protein [Pedosphaera sp.]
MASNDPSTRGNTPTGFGLAPIHGTDDSPALRICVFARLEPDAATNPFLLLRELPGSRVYLGAVCDASARIQEYVELCVQTLELRDLTFSNYQERLANFSFDQRWRAEFDAHLAQRRDAVIVTGMETKNPGPVLVKPRQNLTGFVPVEMSKWRVCTDDAVLAHHGLPAYTTSPYRYLYQPDAEPKTFLPTADDAPNNSHVQEIARLKSTPDVRAIFNLHAGLVSVTRFNQLGLEDFLQILEGRAWNSDDAGNTKVFLKRVYSDLHAWSASPKGMPFLLHGFASSRESLNEIFFLKLTALRALFTEVRASIKAHQLPLLNLSPASFRLSLPEVGDHFPALWASRCVLVKPGQAYPLKIKSTEQKYFIRLGRVEPSPFLPEGLGAHSFGIGSVRLRNVLTDTDGTALEGTLVAEDYLGLDSHDLLWFKLPLGQERLEFYAHVYTGETIGPREARFRTVPARLAEPVVAALKRAAGTVFQKSPYEIWPLLSSPCDLYSLGVIATRVLLANSQTNLPVVLDEILSLTRRLSKDAAEDAASLPKLKALLDAEPRLRDLVSPHALIESGLSPQKARELIHPELWLEAVSLLLRLFPGAGGHSYCKNFGDVSPLALETVFDRPIQELDSLVLRLRSVLTPSLAANEEIAAVLLEQLANS